jgi:hypothetical protein
VSYIGFLHVFDLAMLAVTIVCLCGTFYELRKGRRQERAHEQCRVNRSCTCSYADRAEKTRVTK